MLVRGEKLNSTALNLRRKPQQTSEAGQSRIASHTVPVSVADATNAYDKHDLCHNVRRSSHEVKQEIKGSADFNRKDNSLNSDDFEAISKFLRAEILAHDANPKKQGVWVSVSNEYLDALLERFARAKFEIKTDEQNLNRSKVKIIRVPSGGHESAISAMNNMLYDFCNKVKEQWEVDEDDDHFIHCGGLTQLKEKRCNPDTALLYRQRGTPEDPKPGFFMCVIFEVELFNRKISQVHKRMLELMSGWPTVVYGIACKFYKRELKEEGSPFQGVALLYKKNGRGEGVCICIKDIGTTPFVHKDHIPSDLKNLDVDVPPSYPRREGDPAESFLTTRDRSFYAFDLDSDVFYSALPEEYRSFKRVPISLNMFRVTRALDRFREVDFKMIDHQGESRNA